MKAIAVLCALLGLGVAGSLKPDARGSLQDAAPPQNAAAPRLDPLASLVLEEGTAYVDLPDLGKPSTLDSGATATLVGKTYAWRTLRKDETKYRLAIELDVKVSRAIEGKLPHIKVSLSEDDITSLQKFLDGFAAVERISPDALVDYDALAASWGDMDFKILRGSVLMSWPNFGVGNKGWLPVSLEALKKGLTEGRATLEKLKAAKPSARI